MLLRYLQSFTPNFTPKCIKLIPTLTPFFTPNKNITFYIWVYQKQLCRFEDIVFLRTKESADATNEMQSRTGLIETIILEVRDREKIGDAFAKSNALCCTPKLAQEKFCTVGEVMIQHNQDNPLWPLRIQTYFEGKNQEANMLPATVEINSTGMYYLYFMFCDPALKGTIIRGRTVWKNPDGYLPGRMVPLMTFYGLASLAYLVLGLFWFLKFVQFWKDVIQLHYQITAVIALGMSEMALWYFEYANLNATGSRPMVITIWAVTMTAVKKTLSRALLLVVSMGYGVVRPTLGGVTSKVYLLCLMYFIATEALELVEHLGSINDFSRKTKIYLVLPVVFLDASVILWIFSSLSKTLEKLQVDVWSKMMISIACMILPNRANMRKSMAKLDLYRKFTNSLAIFVLLSIAWVGYELYFNASDPLSELWRISWIIPAFWSLLAFSLLVVICILWAPSSNPTRYAYAGETEDDYDEEALSLTTGVRVMAGVRVISDSGTMLERKEKKGSASTEIISDQREDPEEDKRE
ncbi:uncharacterized protein [Nicotiana tomentosiformis]|uniref:uncharacterized protein isoform X3 n=1 Tax=Nicotiana tomentosiformis TaxID=4098 RepID=UPI00051B16A2|nr:transmembrane protein 87B-like isoform X3 [Nicotiana tomentosiformis]